MRCAPTPRFRWLPFHAARAGLALALALGATLPSACRRPEPAVPPGFAQELAIADGTLRARAEIDDFLAALARGHADLYSIRVRLHDEFGTEHFWLTNVTWDGEYLRGRIDDEPSVVRSVHRDDAWKVPPHELSDWMYVVRDRIYGGYTMDPLLAALPAEKAAELRRRLVR